MLENQEEMSSDSEEELGKIDAEIKSLA